MANNYQDVFNKINGNIDELSIKLKKLHTDILNNAKELNSAFDKSNTTSIKEINKEIKEVQLKYKELNEVKKQSILVEKEIQAQIKTKVDLEKKEQIEARKRILLENEKQKRLDNNYKNTNRSIAQDKKKQKEIQKLNSDYNRLDLELKKVSRDYQDLAAKRAMGEKLSLKELGTLNKLETRLKVLSTAYKRVNQDLVTTTGGVHRTSGAFDSLGFSVAQITRESPAFINSMNTGFMAISNNIPVFVDEINKLQRANKALMEQGKPQINILKKVGSAFFGWQSLISASIVTLTIFGPKIVEYVSDMFKVEKQTNRASESLKEFNEAQKSGSKSASSQITKLQALFEVTRDVTQEEWKRLKAADKIIEMSNGRIKSQEKLNLLEENSIIIQRKLIKSISQRQIATALLSKNDERNQEIASNLIEIDERRLKIIDLTNRKIVLEDNLRKASKISLDDVAKARRSLAETTTILINEEFKESELIKKNKELRKINNEVIQKARLLSDEFVEDLLKGNKLITKSSKDLFDFEKYLLEQKIKRSKENAEDDKNTFKERNGYLEEFHNQSVELNKMIVNNEINELKRKRIEIQNDSELTISQKKELLNEISDLQLKADIEQKNRASQHSKDMAKIRDDIRSDVFSEIKKDLEEQKKFAEFSRNQELADAQGDKEKIKEINDRYNKAMLESQMQYLDEVFLNTEGITESQKKIILNMINEIQIQLNKGKEDVKNNLKEIQDVAKDIFATLTDSFSNVFNIDTSKFNFIFDEISKGFDKSEETMSKLFSKENISAWADASKEIIGGVLNASLQRYEIELQQAQIFRDQILNDDLSTEEQKVAARRKFEEEERRIKTERAKQERENTLIQIAVDTAASVAKVLSQTGVIAPFVIPSIVAIGLAQAALVSSQPLPKFEHGTDNAPEGWAITQEKRAEPIVDKHGNLKTMGSKRGDSLTYLQKGDKVFKSREHFFKEFDIDNIQRAVFQMNTSSNGDILSQKIIDNSLLREVGGLRKDIDTMGRRIEKIASRPISNNVKVELKDQRPY